MISRRVFSRLALSSAAVWLTPVGAAQHAPPVAPPTDPAIQRIALMGRWFGTVAERHGKDLKEYPVELRLEQLIIGQQAGGSGYPSFRCAAKLYYSGTDGTWYVFQEQPLDRRRCGSGQVRVKVLEPGKVSWQ